MIYSVYENICIHKGKENELEKYLHCIPSTGCLLGDGNGVLGMRPGMSNNTNFIFFSF